ncbi:MAG: hypothetical protein VB876_00375 [Pirellulales bacterium]
MVHSGIATCKGDRDRRAQTKSAIDVGSAAENLSKHKGELYLDGLTSLSDAAAWRDYEKRVEANWLVAPPSTDA